MGKRYGRNQKRRAREELDTISKQLDASRAVARRLRDELRTTQTERDTAYTRAVRVMMQETPRVVHAVEKSMEYITEHMAKELREPATILLKSLKQHQERGRVGKIRISAAPGNPTDADTIVLTVRMPEIAYSTVIHCGIFRGERE